MNGGQTSQLQALILRVQGGDDMARRDLINQAYPKLRRLAGKILAESFPRLKQQPALQQTSDIANEAAVRLYQALEEVPMTSVREFFRLAAWRMRLILLDLARKGSLAPTPDVPLDALESPWPHQPADSATTPPSAAWSRLHEQVEALDEAEREVVDLLFYHGLTEVEAAELLEVSTRTVRRRWASARIKLYEALKDAVPGWDGLLPDTPTPE